MGSSSVFKYSWPSTVNVGNFVTVKPSLEEKGKLTNFNIWKKQMLCLLESQEVLGFVNGEIPPPKETNTVPAAESSDVEYEQKLWRRTDSLVKGWIFGSIGKDALDAVWELETAREVWSELNKIFNEEKSFNDKRHSEIQPESDANAHGEGGETAETGEYFSTILPQSTVRERGQDFSRYFPLHHAALRGDWESATNFFEKDKEAATASISIYSETALHLAVHTGKANDFVKKLVELLPPEALALRTCIGSTALHYAAVVGNTEAAIALVNKNPNLLYILSGHNRLPVHHAAAYCQKDTLEYLISMSKPNVEHSPFEGHLGVQLLNLVIASGYFDVASGLIEKYPDLARSTDADGHSSALSTIANMESVFPSGEHFSWWQRSIYRCIPLRQPKWKADRETSGAGDVESVRCNAPAYKKCSSSFQIISGVIQKLEFMLWEFIQHLVPQVKDIRDKKAVHQQALELVRGLSLLMVSPPNKETLFLFQSSFLKAANRGISEILEVILEMYPMVYLTVDVEENNAFLMAARYRYENVFNIIYNMSDRKYDFFDSQDSRGNNLMHMCGKLAPPDRLNLVSGAALQMQRELQWFKEMESIVHPSHRTWTNSENQTPQMLFTEEHKQLKAEGERWMKDTANACTIAAALIATVVFAAIFTVPGGFATESGIPIFSNQLAFVLFAISDAISLFTSILSLLMFLSILTSRYAEEDFLYALPKRLSIGLLSLYISITFMMAAFSATLYIVFIRKVAWLLIPVAAFASLSVDSFEILQFPLLVDVVYSTYGPGIFGRKRDRLFY